MKFLMVVLVLVVAFSFVVSPIMACCPNGGGDDDCGDGSGHGGCGHKLVQSNTSGCCGDCGCNNCSCYDCSGDCCQH